MNLPNKLTLLRMCLIPVFLLFLLWEGLPNNYLWALLIFAAASITDTLDGQIARRRGLVTDFGKFMDPLADKLLVMSALVGFVDVMDVPPTVIIVILAREFLVTALRTLAADNGVVIAADGWGKLKTVLQMFWICFTLLLLWVMAEEIGPGWVFAALSWVHIVGMTLVVAVTIISGFNYMWKNRQLFLRSK